MSGLEGAGDITGVVGVGELDGVFPKDSIDTFCTDALEDNASAGAAVDEGPLVGATVDEALKEELDAVFTEDGIDTFCTDALEEELFMSGLEGTGGVTADEGPLVGADVELALDEVFVSEGNGLTADMDFAITGIPTSFAADSCCFASISGDNVFDSGVTD